MEDGVFDDIDQLLLKHEYYELKYMKNHNCTYEEAHEAASKLYDWAKEVFGE